MVATANLGERAGLLAGAALMLDYVLNVAVGISAGVGAIVSAIPRLQPHILGLCLAILLVLTFVNLRGVREAGLAFMAPTLAFVACLSGVIVAGSSKLGLMADIPCLQRQFPDPDRRSVRSACGYW
jgi:amino acid transporter